MLRPRVLAVALLLLVAGAGLASAEDGASDYELRWRVTGIGVYTETDSRDDDDDVGGFFDQYEFTPNKSSSFPFQLGIREGALDLFRGPHRSAVFQSRLWSPTANLGVSGSQVDDPFFNQQLLALTRLEGIDVDVHYQRMRTEQLRLFPNTEGAGILYDDRTRRDDRFYRERTGFQAEGRLRPFEAFELDEQPGAWLRPELSLRGGHQQRDGRRQLRSIVEPSNQWIGISPGQDRAVSDVGGGLLVAPDGLLTLSFDFDYQQLRFDDPVQTLGSLGFAPPKDQSTIDFTPETNRYTGTVRFNSRIGERAVIEGGFLVSELEQTSKYTPRQRSAGLRDNEVRYYGANASFDVALRDDLSFTGLLKYDQRDNDIERSTRLFNQENQVYPFVDDWERFVAEGELVLQYWAASRAAVGLRYLDVERDRDFATPGLPRILRQSTHLGGDSRIATLYVRTTSRPWRALNVEAELGYRWAPDTGYAMDLDDNFYGELRVSHVFALRRPLMVTAYVKGSVGDNDDFRLTDGLGPVPAGERLPREYERAHVTAGLTTGWSPWEHLNFTASVFYTRDDHDSTLDLSTVQRYFQDIVPIDFTRDGKMRFENEQTSLVLGMHAVLDERTDASFSYAYTRVQADYSGSDTTEALLLVERNRKIESDTHVLDFELRHRLRDGLELLAGYRFQDHDDDGPVPESVASVVSPRTRTTDQHTVTVGVTLTSEFFQR